MDKKKYIAIKKENDIEDFLDEKIWDDVNHIIIGQESYLWVNNGYNPTVIVKAFHTQNYIYLNYKVFEKKINIKHTTFGSDVWKDSCIEFFINPFPNQSKEYFNIEINAIGVPLIGVGATGDDSKRYYFKEDEVSDWTIISSIKEPQNGEHGKEFWSLHLRIPKSFFEKYYEQSFNVDYGIVNFYKCGDETEFEHFGAWNKVESEEPNFHLPEYFGEISFADNLSGGN